MKCSYPCLKLNNGKNFPILGLGTWNGKADDVTRAVKEAIDIGYRHIDCAYIYQNEAAVGAALREKMEDGTIKREDIFITSKVWNSFHSKAKVTECLNITLKSLGLAYLDLYLIHWPVGYQEGGEDFPKDADGNVIPSDVDYLETWLAMEDLVKEGLVRSIGVSNFNKDQTERILEGGSIAPAVNQVECHPYLNQSKLIEYSKDKGIVITAYSPLGSPTRPWAKPDDPALLEDERFKAIAEKHNKTVAQVLIKYQIQRGVVCIPKSVTKSRILENFQMWDFELSPEDVSTIDGFDCNGRMVAVEWMKDFKHYPFNTEF